MRNTEFWKRTKALIKVHNMTQKQFADYLGFSRHTVRGWIYHNRVPHLNAAYDIAFILGVTLEYLISGKDKDIADMRLKELELRKSSARILELIDNAQKELQGMRPLAEHWARESS